MYRGLGLPQHRIRSGKQSLLEAQDTYTRIYQAQSHTSRSPERPPPPPPGPASLLPSLRRLPGPPPSVPPSAAGTSHATVASDNDHLSTFLVTMTKHLGRLQLSQSNTVDHNTTPRYHHPQPLPGYHHELLLLTTGHYQILLFGPPREIRYKRRKGKTNKPKHIRESSYTLLHPRTEGGGEGKGGRDGERQGGEKEKCI